MDSIQRRTFDGWEVELDVSEQVLSLEIPPMFARANEPLLAPLRPTLPPLKGFVPGAALFLKAKQFDDGLYAAVELAAQQGSGLFAGKTAWLKGLTERLVAGGSDDWDDACTGLFAACELGGVSVDLPDARRGAVDAQVSRFLGDEFRSKPLAFYTWTEELTRIFRQDRMLQSPLPASAGLTAIVRALAGSPPLRDTYASYLRLISQLTNPLAMPDLRELLDRGDQVKAPRRKWCVFPPSRSHETDLILKLYGDKPIPDGFDLMEEMIKRIRADKLSLEPSEQSGWYDFQTWSLEPLVAPDRMPESRRLRYGSRYRDHLIDLFKGAFALTRETHAKQLAMPMAAGCYRRPTLSLRPELSVEPLAACYLRRGAGYRFVRSVLVEAFGAEGLAGLHRQGPDGPQAVSLLDELTAMESLFVGAYLTVCREVGLAPDAARLSQATESQEQAEGRFKDWTKNMATDPDVARDARMMVPVFFDLDRKKTKVWAFLGWRASPLSVSFATPPRVVSCKWKKEPEPEPEPTSKLEMLRRKFRPAPRPEIPPEPEIEFAHGRVELFTPVMAEVYVGKLLDRTEFRRHCDQHGTREAILANLS